MTVLFTKIFPKPQVFENLNKDIQTAFLEVLKIKFRPIKPYKLKNRSLIFSSVNGVESFFKNKFIAKNDIKTLPYNKIYCVGHLTRLKVKEYGLNVFKTLKNAKELRNFIIENSNCEDFLHICGSLSLDIFNTNLPLQNIKYKKLISYDTCLLYPKTDENYDAIVFFSPSGVRSFAKNNSVENATLFSIGDTTSAELQKITNKTIITSQEHTLNSLLNLINKRFEVDNHQ